MHICLPDTREVKPAHGSAYLLYNIHIDGLYHCSLRYKQLLHLHQALSKKFTSPYHQLPPFPPKKLLPLSATQVEERRQQLEKYLQNISQDKAISNSSIFNLFLLEAQRESTRIRENQVHLDIELVNGQKIRLQIVTHDSADAVLTAVCRALGLDDRYHAYFCLCLCGYDVIRDKLIIKRRLSFFESPYVTLQMAIQQQEQLQNVLTNYSSSAPSTTNAICCCQSCSTQHNHYHQLQTTGVPFIGSSSGSCVNSNNNHYNNQDGNNNNQYHYQIYNNNRIVSSSQSTSSAKSTFVTHRILLRKSYWDPIYDTYILNDSQALNLLFIQTVYDIKHSLMFVDRETYHQLESLLASDSKMEYILLARTLKYYNYVHFEPCYSDYPRPRTKVMISIGSRELNMRVLKSPKSFINNNAPNIANNKTNTQSLTNTKNPTPSSTPSSSSSCSSSMTTTQSAIQQQQQATNNSNNAPVATIMKPIKSSSSSSSSTTTTPLSNSKSNQQVSVPSEHQILYCTSSLVPSGYQHLITKEDLVEEEYNFKVPLIRCWRLTSLETLNSNNSTALPSSNNYERRKSLSSFNCNSNDIRPLNHNNNYHHHPITNSGTGGASLMAALTSGRSGFCRTMLNETLNNNDNDNDNHYCQHENHHGCQFNGSMCGLVDPSQFCQYELSFEYLVSKDTLRWITISSDQAIFISISLQGVVDELVSKRDIKACLYKGSGVVSDSEGGHHHITQPSAVLLPATPGIRTSSSSNSNNINNNNNQKSSSFTYMYRDGSQKLLSTSNQQLIDKFGTTLGYSPSNPYALAAARQRQQVRASTTAGLFLSNASRFSSLASFASSSSSPPETGGYHIYDPNNHLQYHHQQHHDFEISSFKKAPSPIINDAFEGATNEDDL